jgi:hypothetical protein
MTQDSPNGMLQPQGLSAQKASFRIVRRVMVDHSRDQGDRGLTRRELIRRGAIAGGLAWSAPVLQSLGTPAFAQGYPCRPGCFWVKVERPGPEGGVGVACEDANGTVTCPNCLGGRSQDLGGCCWVAGRVVFEPENGGCATLTLPPGCEFLGGFSKGCDPDCPPATLTADGAEFCCPDGKDVSHVEFCFCCE